MLCEYVLLPLVNKKDVEPVASQDIIRWNNQTEDLDEEGQSGERLEQLPKKQHDNRHGNT